jgi:hypothetical protein
VSFGLQDVKELNGMHVYLEDRVEGKVTDILTESYSAYVDEGTHNDRFKLRIAMEENAWNAWIANGEVTLSNEETITAIRLISLDGKTVASSRTKAFNNWDTLANGVYLLEVETTERKHIQKIVK